VVEWIPESILFVLHAPPTNIFLTTFDKYQSSSLNDTAVATSQERRQSNVMSNVLKMNEAQDEKTFLLNRKLKKRQLFEPPYSLLRTQV
jgi:hypothetical protein